MGRIGVSINAIIQTVIMFFLFNSFLTRKRNKKYIYPVFGGVILVYAVKCIIPIPSWCNLLLSILLAIIVTCCNYKDKLIKKVFATLFHMIIMMASELISSDIISSIFRMTYSDAPVLGKEQVALLANFISFLIIVYVIKIPSKKIREISLSAWFTVLLIPIFSFGLLLAFDMLTINSNFSYTIQLNIFIVICLLYFNFAVFNFFESYSAKLELKRTEAIVESNNENYKILEQNERDLRMLKHDICKHVNIIKRMIALDDIKNAEKYINDMDGMISDIPSITYTNHITLDSILNISALKAKTLGIQYFVKSNIQSEIKIKDVDLTTILQNAIDNAIEAAAKAKKKYVVVNLNVYMDYINITIQNSYKDFFGKPDYMTTKDNAREHGWGIPSIKQVVKFYNGKFEMDAENGINTLKIHIQNSDRMLAVH